MRKHVVLCVLSLATLRAQTQVDLKTQAKAIDFTAAPATKPAKAGTILPGTCGTGEFFFNTAAPAGANLYACTSPNVWNLQGGQGFTSGAQPPTGSCVAGQTYLDTANANTWLCESPGIWQKALTTTNIGELVMTGQNGSTPPTPASGNTSLFFSSTGKVGQSVDDAGNLGTMVRATDCSVSAQLVQKINADGTVNCAIAVGPVTYNFPAGGGSTASPQSAEWWQDGTTTTVCPAGTPFQCALHWNSGTSILGVTTSVPRLWTGGTVSVALKYEGNGANNAVQPSVASGCASNGGAFSFNAPQNFSVQTTAASSYYISTLSGLTMTGCAADSIMVLKFARVDAAGFLNLAEASITFNIP